MDIYFSIYRQCDNSCVEINDALDRAICDALDLEYHHVNETGDVDFGHFYFPECMEDSTVFGGQISISWVGFLNSLVIYSRIGIIDKASEYDLESALAWCIDYSVEFPKSSTLLLSRLLDFINRKKYYINIHGHYHKRIYGNGHVNPYDKSRIIENETGLFLVDDAVRLKCFYPFEYNLKRNPNTSDKSGETIIDTIIIPSEVNEIDIEFVGLGLVIHEVRNLRISRELVIDEMMKKEGSNDLLLAKDFLSRLWRITIHTLDFY